MSFFTKIKQMMKCEEHGEVHSSNCLCPQCTCRAYSALSNLFQDDCLAPPESPKAKELPKPEVKPAQDVVPPPPLSPSISSTISEPVSEISLNTYDYQMSEQSYSLPMTDLSFSLPESNYSSLYASDRDLDAISQMSFTSLSTFKSQDNQFFSHNIASYDSLPRSESTSSLDGFQSNSRSTGSPVSVDTNYQSSSSVHHHSIRSNSSQDFSALLNRSRETSPINSMTTPGKELDPPSATSNPPLYSSSSNSDIVPNSPPNNNIFDHQTGAVTLPTSVGNNSPTMYLQSAARNAAPFVPSVKRTLPQPPQFIPNVTFPPNSMIQPQMAQSVDFKLPTTLPTFVPTSITFEPASPANLANQARQQKGPVTPTQKCFKCGQFGHIFVNCPLNAHNTTPVLPNMMDSPDVSGSSVSRDACYKCGRTGHTARECTFDDTRVCFVCRQMGHISKDCPKSRRNKKKTNALHPQSVHTKSE
ncbi:hypothetical protein BLNAU_4750 [Blattamonas nauphoetae]|uniref:CCHC-type domain-containing protein n=1 Tax=Blattamonas nauphoetae TaxID=2049346 RepID=A0ABQ9Y8W0_9EUKA|nr:hypothetical protein BLNAU_4750 [Blattamonas nauphoetae]